MLAWDKSSSKASKQDGEKKGVRKEENARMEIILDACFDKNGDEEHSLL